VRIVLWAASIVAAYWVGREVEFRLWELANDWPDEPETTSTDPVPMALTEVVALLTRDWPSDLRHEWEYNR
jgi:hypothetical protein